MSAKKRVASPVYIDDNKTEKQMDFIDLTDEPEAGPGPGPKVLPSSPIYIDLDDVPERGPEVGDMQTSATAAEHLPTIIKNFTRFVELVAPKVLGEYARSWYQRNMSQEIEEWLDSKDEWALFKIVGMFDADGFILEDWEPIEDFVELRIESGPHIETPESQDEFEVRTLFADFAYFYMRDFNLWMQSGIPTNLISQIRQWSREERDRFRYKSMASKVSFFEDLLNTFRPLTMQKRLEEFFETYHPRIASLCSRIRNEVTELRSDPYNSSWKLWSKLLEDTLATVQRLHHDSLQETVSELFSSISAQDIRSFEQLDVYRQLQYLLHYKKFAGTSEALIRMLDPSYDPRPLTRRAHYAVAVRDVAGKIFNRCKVFRQYRRKDKVKTVTHRCDRADPDSPSSVFSFIQFEGMLRLDLVICYLEYLSLQEFHKVQKTVKTIEFEELIVLLYTASKDYNKDQLAIRTSSSFDDHLIMQVKYYENRSLKVTALDQIMAASTQVHKAESDREEYTGMALAYMKSLTYAQAYAFSVYPPDLKLQALSKWRSFNSSEQKHKKSAVSYSAPAPQQARPHARRDVPGDSEEFDHFLREVQEEANGDENAGTNTTQDIENAANEIGAVPAHGDKYSLPGMLCDLHPHQVIGVAWMVKRERPRDDDGNQSNVRGGVLADAMGLGKTVQALGVMVKNRPSVALPTVLERLETNLAPSTKPKITLIVCPVALIHQWAREITTKAPGCFDVRVHHGATKLRSMAELRKYDVIITSYGTLTNEYPIRRHGNNLSQADKDREERRLERHKGILFRIKFLRLILDEAHTIKNPAANVSVACCNLESFRQWCLTGTPFQNKVDDIYPLLRVLQVPYFKDRATFREQISGNAHGARKLREVLAPFSKRRTKDDLIAGKPIVLLPEKTVKITTLKFDEAEESLYKRVQEKMVETINKFLLEGTAVKKINHIFTMLLRLRQLCIHPYLILDHLAAKHGMDESEFMQSADMAMQAIEEDNDSVLCGLCQEQANSPVISRNCKHCFCAECARNEIEDENSECPVCSKPLGPLVNYDEQNHVAASVLDTRLDDSGDPGPSSRKDLRPGASPKKESLGSPTKRRRICSEQRNGSSGSFARNDKRLTMSFEESDDEELPELSMQKCLDASRVVESERKLVASNPRPVVSVNTVGSVSIPPDLKPVIKPEENTSPSRRLLVQPEEDDPFCGQPFIKAENGNSRSTQPVVKSETDSVTNGPIVKPESDIPADVKPYIKPEHDSAVDVKPYIKPENDKSPSRMPVVKSEDHIASSGALVSRPHSSAIDATFKAEPNSNLIPPRSTQKKASRRYSVDSADLPDYVAPGLTAAERQAELRSWQELLASEFIPSTKLTAVENQLKEWMTMDGCKLIVFSQFVKALDLLAKICESNGWDVLRYQGNMNMRERESTIKKFEDPLGPRILLMSLKAGGVGLNLVCANKVILLDFWWNAAAEHQAIDRCHRMGQVREVVVCRMYLPGTVEEKILALQESKLATAGVVLGESQSGGKIERLNLQDLMGLFGRVTHNANGIQQIVAAQ